MALLQESPTRIGIGLFCKRDQAVYATFHLMSTHVHAHTLSHTYTHIHIHTHTSTHTHARAHTREADDLQKGASMKMGVLVLFLTHPAKLGGRITKVTMHTYTHTNTHTARLGCDVHKSGVMLKCTLSKSGAESQRSRCTLTHTPTHTPTHTLHDVGAICTKEV